jgi:hypothetical protein
MARPDSFLARLALAGAVAISATACASAGDPWTDADDHSAREAARVQAGRLCPVDIENATDGALEIYYSAGPERSRKLDRLQTGSSISITVPCEARWVTVSGLGAGTRYAKRADLDLLDVTTVRVTRSDLKR